jgi:hypothetical protein
MPALGHPVRAFVAAPLLMISAYQALLALVQNTRHPALGTLLTYYALMAVAVLAFLVLNRACHRWEAADRQAVAL